MLQRLADGVTVTDLQPCITLADVQELRGCALSQVENSLQQYILNLVRATRQDEITLASVLVVP